MQLTIPQRKHARVLGSLAETPLQPGQELSAVLVQSRRDFSTRLLSCVRCAICCAVQCST
jgi:hypothetical protein